MAAEELERERWWVFSRLDVSGDSLCNTRTAFFSDKVE